MDQEKREQLREKAVNDSEDAGKLQRFGLFSQPISTAIGDTTYIKEKKADLDEDGNVKTAPRNFTTFKSKKGKGPDVYFANPDEASYITIGDTFKNTASNVLTRTTTKNGHLLAGHESAFRPAKQVTVPVQATYEHQNERADVKKQYRDEDGGVIVEPRNFLTNPPKKGKTGEMTSFGGDIPYMEDDYNRPRELAKKERLYHESKLQDKPFSQRVGPQKTFNGDEAIYGEDKVIPHKKPVPKRKPGIEHDQPFKPSHPPRKGINKTLEKFPEYKENPPKPITRKRPVEGEEIPPGFKPTTNSWSRPTPSVACNPRNLKASFPSVFRR